MCDYKIVNYTTPKGKQMSRKAKIDAPVSIIVPLDTTEHQTIIESPAGKTEEDHVGNQPVSPRG